MKQILLLLQLTVFNFHLQFITHAKLYNYYDDKALNFLKDYGEYYHLFDRFFNRYNQSSVPFSFAYKGSTRSIKSNHRVRSYDFDHSPRATAFPQSWHENHYRDEVSERLVEFNNVFRYGSKPNDRFYTVFFTNDPSNPNSGAVVQFQGDENGLSHEDIFYCQYSYPMEVKVSAKVEDGFSDVLARPMRHNVVTCPVPVEVSDALARLDGAHHVKMHFTNETNVLIYNIVIPLPDPLDMREHNVSVTCMIDDFHEEMLAEWIIYNILIGVDHFYLYDITRRNWTMANSAVEPFFHANLITILYWAYVPIKEADTPCCADVSREGQIYSHSVAGVQPVSMNTAMFQYGDFNQFMTFYDVDEFLVFSAEVFNNKTLPVILEHGNVITFLFNNVFGLADKRAPAIQFDAVEMGCQDEKMKHGHGKIFVKPNKCRFVPSPHRYNDYWTVWTNPQQHAAIHHFNRFRYSIGSKNFVRINRYEQRFITLTLLQQLIGLKFEQW